MFGKLSLDLIPHDPIVIGAIIFMVFLVASILITLTVLKKWTWLYKEWLTTVDHKKIGIMYVIIALLMMVRGLADAFLMRSHLALSALGVGGYLPPDHYDQIFTAHGVILIFFMAMPLMTAFFNLVIPLQIGARDVAFPFLNALSLWLFVVGVILVNLSMVIGEFSTAGWVGYPPLSGIKFSPGIGVDYYIWALQISGIGTTLTGVNFFVTIMKMRAKGMKLFDMPVFTWSVLTSSTLIMLAFPLLTVSLLLLFLDRYFGMHFFTSDFGGNPMMYINLIWAWGHPEVYILVLPAFGIFSEVVSTFSRKPLFGYKAMVYSLIAITVLSFLVWLHHFFTMGAGAKVNAAFGIATMLISIPTGVKIFNWLFTMYKGKINFSTPMYWLIGFFIVFTLGGITGVMLSIPAADFQFHNSLFLVAHFHNTIIGGVVFGYIAGLTYWWPKFMGFKLHEGIGKAAFWCWFIGFFVAFIPIYIVGLMGMTRRLSSGLDPSWTPYLVMAFIGTLIILLGFALQVLQILVSIFNHKKYAVGRDPWNGRTLEWSLPSPVPFYNFATEVEVKGQDVFWDMKQNKQEHSKNYQPIHMPKNTILPLIVSGFALIVGFALIFAINWLAIVGLVAVVITLLVRSFSYNLDYYVPADEVKAIEDNCIKKEQQLAERI
jgi:cytochrome o ubiquinol oxidase subunit 1